MNCYFCVPIMPKDFYMKCDFYMNNALQSKCNV